MRGQTHEHPAEQALAALKARQFGVFRRDQAIGLGLSEDFIHRALRRGRLTRELPRVYRDPAAPRSREQELMMAQLWAGDGAAISHRSAAVLLGLAGSAPRYIEVTAPIARRAPSGVHLFRGRLVGADVTSRGPLRVVSPTRTLIDLAAVVSDEALEIALDSALSGGLTSTVYLDRRLCALGSQGRKGTGRLAQLLAMREGGRGLESPLETKFFRLIRRHRLPQPQLGYEVGPYRLDFAYPHAKLGIELEGYAYHSGRSAWLNDAPRRNYFSDHGWLVLYFTWDDVTKRPDDVITTLRHHLFPKLVS